MAAASRIGTVTRTTSESNITVTIDLDGSGHVDVNTGVPFWTICLQHSVYMVPLT